MFTCSFLLLNHDRNLFFSSQRDDDLAMSKNVVVLIFYKKLLFHGHLFVSFIMNVIVNSCLRFLNKRLLDNKCTLYRFSLLNPP